MKSLFFLCVSLFVTVQGRASVNMKNASFETKEKEYFLERTYNSRSMHKGLLGIGWCTNLEFQIEVNSVNMPSFYECDKKILIKRYENINNEYHITVSNGNKYVFDKKKRLIKALNSNNSIKFEIHYKSNKLNSIIDERQITWKVNWKDQFISSIESSLDCMRFEQNQSNLLAASIKQNSIWMFTYDELDNLTSIKNNQGIYKKIIYDLDTDQIRSIEDHHGCTEKFNFTEHSENNLHLQFSKVTQECKGSLVKDLTYEFYFLKNNDGSFTHVNTKLKKTGGLQ